MEEILVTCELWCYRRWTKLSLLFQVCLKVGTWVVWNFWLHARALENCGENGGTFTVWYYAEPNCIESGKELISPKWNKWNNHIAEIFIGGLIGTECFKWGLLLGIICFSNGQKRLFIARLYRYFRFQITWYRDCHFCANLVKLQMILRSSRYDYHSWWVE